LGTLIRGAFGLPILLIFLALGRLIPWVTGLPIPGNVLGMVLLLAALATGLIPLALVERAADKLLNNLGLFFVPPGVGIMLHWGLIRREGLPILAALVLSTFAVLAITGLTARILAKPEPKP
jgi:holin-like protein